MQIHDREMITARAKVKFTERYYGYEQMNDIPYDIVVNGFSQAMINLNKDDKNILDAHHQHLEDALASVIQEFELTYGETIMMLSEHIASSMKYLIRYERHGNFDTPGGLA